MAALNKHTSVLMGEERRWKGAESMGEKDWKNFVSVG